MSLAKLTCSVDPLFNHCEAYTLRGGLSEMAAMAPDGVSGPTWCPQNVSVVVRDAGRTLRASQIQCAKAEAFSFLSLVSKYFALCRLLYDLVFSQITFILSSTVPLALPDSATNPLVNSWNLRNRIARCLDMLFNF